MMEMTAELVLKTHEIDKNIEQNKKKVPLVSLRNLSVKKQNRGLILYFLFSFFFAFHFLVFLVEYKIL